MVGRRSSRGRAVLISCRRGHVYVLQSYMTPLVKGSTLLESPAVHVKAPEIALRGLALSSLISIPTPALVELARAGSPLDQLPNHRAQW
jgi:hypothetical protein